MSENATKGYLSKLLKDSRLEELELNLRNPNFFSILRLQSQEIRHSNFLAWLLDPNEGHNLGSIFLKRFLKAIFSDPKAKGIDEFVVDSLNLHNIRVLREWRHIDLLIVYENFIVCIENKVFSGEHSNQLRRYSDILKAEFPEIPEENLVFVLLTLDGDTPESEDDAARYIQHTYGDIKTNIDGILRVYGESLSAKVRIYLDDYLEILRRHLMGEDDELTKLAKGLYQDHKNAIDFIFENKPDRLYEVREIFSKEIEKAGYKLGSCNKGYVRFLPCELDKIIPRTGTGLKNRESFLFEIDYWPKKITFKTVVGPGNNVARELISDALKKITGANTPKGATWLVHHSNLSKIDVTAQKYEDNEEQLRADIRKILEDNKQLISRVECELLKHKEELISLGKEAQAGNLN